jgi:DNA-binding MarR family transcriptional regulator
VKISTVERGRRRAAKAASSLRLDDYLPYRLSVAANAVSGLIARAYQTRFGLTIPQWRLIAVLGEDGPLTQQALCARTVMDKVTVSRSSGALAERGLIYRTPNATDGRSHRLELTAPGKALYFEIAPAALAYEAKLLTQFSAFERQSALNLLRRLEVAAIDLAGFGE